MVRDLNLTCFCVPMLCMQTKLPAPALGGTHLNYIDIHPQWAVFTVIHTSAARDFCANVRHTDSAMVMRVKVGAEGPNHKGQMSIQTHQQAPVPVEQDSPSRLRPPMSTGRGSSGASLLPREPHSPS